MRVRFPACLIKAAAGLRTAPAKAGTKGPRAVLRNPVFLLPQEHEAVRRGPGSRAHKRPLSAKGLNGRLWVESGWSALEFADRVSGREARPFDTASPPPVRASTNGRKSLDLTTKASPMR